MRTAVLLAIAVCLSTVAAPVPKAVKKVTDDATRLDGRWVSVTLDAGGGSGAVDDDTYRIEFKNGTVCVTSTKFGWPVKWKPVTLDLTASPKTLDITQDDRSVCKGIFKCDGDTLVWCHSTNISRPAPSRTYASKNSKSSLHPLFSSIRPM